MDVDRQLQREGKTAVKIRKKWRHFKQRGVAKRNSMQYRGRRSQTQPKLGFELEQREQRSGKGEEERDRERERQRERKRETERERKRETERDT